MRFIVFRHGEPNARRPYSTCTGTLIVPCLMLACCLFMPCSAGVMQTDNLDRDAEGLTLLHHATGRGDTKEVQSLLDHGADLYTLDSKMGVSILNKAVYYRSVD